MSFLDCRLRSLTDVLEFHAAEQPERQAYVFLSERGEEDAVLSFAQLEQRALAVARRLQAHGARAGERALLVYPPGLDFLVALFGCFLSRVIAVPMMLPRRTVSRDASAAIAADCGARFVMTNARTAEGRPDFAGRFAELGPPLLVPDIAEVADLESERPTGPDRDDLAFLQYTSGSTSTPKGVMVTHGNLLANLEMMRLAFSTTGDSTCVGWVPHYHDMGLIMQLLQSLHAGACCVLMSPANFLHRPLGWIRAIHRYRGEISYTPNFAFDLCVARFNEEQMRGIDLSCWKLALNGAEPVRTETLRRFAAKFAPYGFDPTALYPAYGLAEATVFVSGGRRGAGPRTRSVSRTALKHHEVAPPAGREDTQVLVGCGRKIGEEELAIVDPDACRRVSSARIGEIWVRGPHVAQGYWRKADATARDFQAALADEPEHCWLRTGDLGFLDEAGELYITGRIKDVIIIRGVNHYPQDIEYTAENSHPALRSSGAAAFAVTDAHGDQKVVLVQEVERTSRSRIDFDELEGCIREAVANEHDVAVHSVVLIRPGTLPKTTSGKVQRDLTRRLWEQGALEVLSQPQGAASQSK